MHGLAPWCWSVCLSCGAEEAEPDSFQTFAGVDGLEVVCQLCFCVRELPRLILLLPAETIPVLRDGLLNLYGFCRSAIEADFASRQQDAS